MRKLCLVLFPVVIGILCGGCPSEPEQYPIVGTDWMLEIETADGYSYSGTCQFSSDGKMVADADLSSPFEGTYTLKGSTIQFSGHEDSSEHTNEYWWEEHISASGTLEYDGVTLEGKGTYKVSYLDSDPEYNYSGSGSFTVSGRAQSLEGLGWLLLSIVLPWVVVGLWYAITGTLEITRWIAPPVS
jgi:hypothetical protein